jgi:hypothetical protein
MHLVVTPPSLTSMSRRISCQVSLPTAMTRNCSEQVRRRTQESPPFASIACHDTRKACPCNELHHLRKQGLAGIHRKSSRVLNLGNYTKKKKRVSNRLQIKLTARPCQFRLKLQINPV